MKEIAIITEPKTLTEIVKVAPTLPTIGKLIREGNEDIKKVAMKAIIEIFEFYNEQLNPIQIPLILEQFLNQAKPLTPPEISIFRANCLNGSYPLKFRLTPNVFIDWLKEYQYDRMEAFENLNLKAKIETEKQPISEKTTEMLKELSDKIKPKPIFSTDQPPTESDRDKFIKQQMSYFKFKFNEVWKVQGMTETDELSPREYVTFGSKMYFQNDYIKMMVEKDLVNYDKKRTS